MNLRTSVALSCACLLLASCAPRHPKDIEQIDSLRAEAESLVKAQALMGYESWAYGRPSNQDSLYQAHAALFTLDNIRLTRRAEEEEPDALQKKRLTYFRRYLTTEYISRNTAPLLDRISNMEAAATVAVDGQAVPYRQIAGMISNEQSQQRRAMLYAAANPVLDSLNVVLQDVEQKYRQLARDLGYGSYTLMAEDCKGYSVSGMKPMAEQVLASTDSLYRVLLGDMLRDRLHLAPGAFRRYDIGPLFRGRQFDKYFPSGRMIDMAAATYKGLGIDIKAQTNLTLDTASRPEKNPRAVCYPISIPDDIRLSIKPIGGADDYAALFHEMGHAQHYANTKEHAFEFKYAGEPTVTESYAFLSEYMLANTAWLRSMSSMPTPVLKQYARSLAFQRLLFVRRYCAKILYELELHGGAQDAPALYADLQARAAGCTTDTSDGKRYLTDVDALYYSASYVRAWFLEAQENAQFTKDFGTNWFAYPDAGQKLLSLWANGDKLNGDEVASTLGVGPIAPDAWLAEIKALVLFSTQ